MKKSFLFPAFISIFIFASCSEDRKKENNPDAQPAESQIAPDQETLSVDKTKQDKTSVKVDENGVQYENRDGSKRSDVKISRDSSKVEITKPK
jgi:hypothetical protein